MVHLITQKEYVGTRYVVNNVKNLVNVVCEWSHSTFVSKQDTI